MAALVTLTELKRWLGSDETVDDAALQKLADDVSAAFEGAAGLFLQAPPSSAVEFILDGTGLAFVVVPVGKITELTKVESRKDLIADWEELAVASCEIGGKSGLEREVWRKDGESFPFGRRLVRITCKGGYTTLPSYVRLAILERCGLSYRNRATASAGADGGGNLGIGGFEGTRFNPGSWREALFEVKGVPMTWGG